MSVTTATTAYAETQARALSRDLARDVIGLHAALPPLPPTAASVAFGAATVVHRAAVPAPTLAGWTVGVRTPTEHAEVTWSLGELPDAETAVAAPRLTTHGPAALGWTIAGFEAAQRAALADSELRRLAITDTDSAANWLAGWLNALANVPVPRPVFMLLLRELGPVAGFARTGTGWRLLPRLGVPALDVPAAVLGPDYTLASLGDAAAAQHAAVTARRETIAAWVYDATHPTDGGADDSAEAEHTPLRRFRAAMAAAARAAEEEEAAEQAAYEAERLQRLAVARQAEAVADERPVALAAAVAVAETAEQAAERAERERADLLRRFPELRGVRIGIPRPFFEDDATPQRDDGLSL